MQSELLKSLKKSKLKLHQKPIKKFTKSPLSLRTGIRRSNTLHLNSLKNKQNSLKGKIMESIMYGYRELLLHEALKKKKIIQHKKAATNLFTKAKERPVIRKIGGPSPEAKFKRVSW
jgi:hypothetical protein